MEKLSSQDELTVMHQFDRLCQLALDGEAADYFRHLAYRANYEVNFSDMTEQELDSIFVMDEYNLDNSHFQVLGYDIEVKDTLLVEALQALISHIIKAASERDDAVSDNDTSRYKLIWSEKIAIPTENLPLAAFLHAMANGAVSWQPPAG